MAGGLDDAYIPRAKDNDARDSGQYGVALRWFVPELNETEFGAYAMKYHSRNPFLSTVRTGNPAAGAANQLASIRGAKYFIDYPEDIRLYGLSFATNLAGVSWGGEASYRPNMPLQLNTADLLSATLTPVGRASLSPLYTTGFSSNVPAGGVVNGYDRKPVLQLQTTVTKLFNQVWGADRLTLVGEVGYNRINGLGDTDGTDLRFGRSPAFGSGILPGATGEATCRGTNVGLANASNPAQQCNSHGFYTADSWGYRVRGQLDYPNVFAGINLAPNLAWSHDVEGTGPNFEEGAKAVSLGLNADYQNTYTAALSYTNYFDGKYNTMTDRDFVSLSLGVNF